MNRQPLVTDNALRILPSKGWTAGWIGRRDRALIMRSQLADLPYEQIARLTVGHISFAGGAASITGPDGATIAPSSDGLLCAPCALVRWLHALDLTVIHTDTSVIASVIGRAAPLTARSPHVCENPQPISAGTRDVPALPTNDRWGILAPQWLSTRPPPRPYLTRSARANTAHHSAAASARARHDETRQGPAAGAAGPADRGPVGAGRSDPGDPITQVAPGIDVTGARAGETGETDALHPGLRGESRQLTAHSGVLSFLCAIHRRFPFADFAAPILVLTATGPCGPPDVTPHTHHSSVTRACRWRQ